MYWPKQEKKIILPAKPTYVKNCHFSYFGKKYGYRKQVNGVDFPHINYTFKSEDGSLISLVDLPEDGHVCPKQGQVRDIDGIDLVMVKKPGYKPIVLSANKLPYDLIRNYSQAFKRVYDPRQWD